MIAVPRKTKKQKERDEYIKKRYTAKIFTICINLFAGAGAGKSTIASGVFSLLKHHNVNAELITEYAKDLVWEGRLHLNRNDIEIFTEQLKRQFRLHGKVDVMITDSPILLSRIIRFLIDEYSKSYFLHNELISLKNETFVAKKEFLTNFANSHSSFFI